MSEKFRRRNFFEALDRLRKQGKLPENASPEELINLLFDEAQREKNIKNGKKWRDGFSQAKEEGRS